MKLKRLVLDKDSRFIGQSIQQSGIRQDYRCLIVGLEEDDSESLEVPNPQRPFAAGDIIWVVGEDDDIADLEKASHAQYPNAKEA
jgi:CPA2 family monovalent cation:H+ antiporter-2